MSGRRNIIAKVEEFINTGLNLTEISERLGLSLSYIKKLSAKIERPESPVDNAIAKLREMPNIEINELGLTKSQKDMLYRSEAWKSEIKPKREIHKQEEALKKVEKEKEETESRIKVKRALESLKEDPLMETSDLDLNDSQKNMLYRTEEWIREIKPKRILSELKNNPKADFENIISKLDIDTLEVLENSTEWKKILDTREEFERYKRIYRDLKEKFKEIEGSENIYSLYKRGFVDIETLKQLRNAIPEEEKYPLSQSATKRLAVSENVAIMHDFRYVQVENEIRILEEQIIKKQSELHKNVLSEFSEETKRLIKNFHRAVSSELEEAEEDNRKWKDAGEVLAKMTEVLAESMEDVKPMHEDGEEFYQQEEWLERENNEFIAGNGKRFGKQGGRKSNKNLLRMQ